MPCATCETVRLVACAALTPECARAESARRERAEGTQFLNTVIGKVRKKVSNQVLWTVHTGFPYLYYTYIRLLYI